MAPVCNQSLQKYVFASAHFARLLAGALCARGRQLSIINTFNISDFQIERLFQIYAGIIKAGCAFRKKSSKLPTFFLYARIHEL